MWGESNSAEEWSRRGRVPVANSDLNEGIRFFEGHYFVLPEESGYSPIGSLSGYVELPNAEADWHSVLGRWESEFAPTFPGWEGRRDFEVVSDARERAPLGANLVERDIVSSLSSIDYVDHARGFRNPTYLNWPLWRAEARKFEESGTMTEADISPLVLSGLKSEAHRISDEEILGRPPRDEPDDSDDNEVWKAWYEEGATLNQVRGARAREAIERHLRNAREYARESRENDLRLGRTVEVLRLSTKGLRVHSMRFTRPIEASIAHDVNGDVQEMLIPGARLVAWIETEMRGNELEWRWLASVYSWKNCGAHPLSRCNAQAQAQVERLVTPLAREWAHLLRDVRKQGGAEPKGDGFEGGFRL